MLAHVSNETKNFEPDSPVFDYHARRFFNNDQRWGDAQDEFYDFIGNVMDRSSFVTGIDVQFGDEIVTLSTCDYPLGRSYVSSRFALFGRRLREGEKIEDFDFTVAREVTPLYFDSWYRNKNTPQSEWEGREWDLSLVHGFEDWLETKPDWCPTVIRSPWV